MGRSDAERFQGAKTYFLLPPEERDPALAEDAKWFEALCTLRIGAQVRGKESRRHKQDEDDRINHAWSRLLQKLPKLKCKLECGDIKPWVDKIIKNILYSFTRRRRRRRTEPLDEAGTPDRDHSAAERHAGLYADLNEALDVLARDGDVDPKNCELVRRHWLEGERLQDVAKSLGLTESAAWGRQHRTFEKLRELLPRHPEWPHLAEWLEEHFPRNREFVKIQRKPEAARSVCYVVEGTAAGRPSANPSPPVRGGLPSAQAHCTP